MLYVRSSGCLFQRKRRNVRVCDDPFEYSSSIYDTLSVESGPDQTAHVGRGMVPPPHSGAVSRINPLIAWIPSTASVPPAGRGPGEKGHKKKFLSGG